MEKLAGRITGKLVDYKCIDDLQRDEYAYAMEMLIETCISVTAIMLMGVYFRVAIPTLFFLIFLYAIKKRSGGFHANTFATCFLVTIAIYLLFVNIIVPVMLTKMNLTYIFLVVAIGIIEVIGAVNHPNMNWSPKEHAQSKRASRTVVAMEGMVIMLMAYLGASTEVIVFMAFAVILSALLLLIAKISKQEVLNEKQGN